MRRYPFCFFDDGLGRCLGCSGSSRAYAVGGECIEVIKTLIHLLSFSLSRSLAHSLTHSHPLSPTLTRPLPAHSPPTSHAWHG